MIIEELVYPYEMTVDLLQQYRGFTSFNLDKDMRIMYRKMLRSARYWRIEPERWKYLLERV